MRYPCVWSDSPRLSLIRRDVTRVYPLDFRVEECSVQETIELAHQNMTSCLQWCAIPKYTWSGGKKDRISSAESMHKIRVAQAFSGKGLVFFVNTLTSPFIIGHNTYRGWIAFRISGAHNSYPRCAKLGAPLR